MTDRTYIQRRAVQESDLASKATNCRAAAAHNALAAAYFAKLAALADWEERQIALHRPPQL